LQRTPLFAVDGGAQLLNQADLLWRLRWQRAQDGAQLLLGKADRLSGQTCHFGKNALVVVGRGSEPAQR
jgi:hypothetical protein